MVAPGEFLFAADHTRQIRELRDIAPAALELHGLCAFLVRTARLIEIEGEAAAFQLLDLHAAPGAGEVKAASGKAERIIVIAAQRGGGLWVVEHGELVVCKRVALGGACAEVDAQNTIGFAQYSDRRIEDVAGQFEESSTGKFGQLLTQRRVGLFAHHRVQLHDFAEPPFTHRAEHKLKCRIVAQHVSHLDTKLVRLGRGQQFAERRQLGPGGFI